MKQIYDLPGVSSAVGDACAYGLCDEHGVPIQKKHRWMSNDTALLHAVGHQCPQHRVHARVGGKLTKLSGVYTDKAIRGPGWGELRC